MESKWATTLVMGDHTSVQEETRGPHCIEVGDHSAEGATTVQRGRPQYRGGDHIAEG